MVQNMASPLRRPARYEDVLAAPSTCVAEIVDGELFTHARPSARHAMVASRLGIQLGRSFYDGEGKPGGWILLDEPELHLGEEILVPDLAAWRIERMPDVPDTPFFDLAPDWICEVLSPSTASFDRNVKLPEYARFEVQHAWLLDPLGRSLQVCSLDQSAQPAGWRAERFEARHPIRAKPFDAIELDLALLFGLGR